MRLRGAAGREVEGVWISRAPCSKHHVPQTRIRNRLIIAVYQLAQKLAGSVIGIDRAIAEIADEQIIGKLPEVCRRLHHAPGSIQRAPGGEALHELAILVEDIHD